MLYIAVCMVLTMLLVIFVCVYVMCTACCVLRVFLLRGVYVCVV